jgi:pimeloyl-ACP methyl ester carboxylesterase
MRPTFRSVAPLLAAAALLVPCAVHAAKPVPLAVEEQGSGSPAIVLVHNIGGDRSDWSAVAPLLAAHHRVLIVELPGHGKSHPPAGPPTVEKAAAALAKTLAGLKVERAILVGHSYGALVALKTALDEPKRAAAVVAVDAATFTPADSERIGDADKVLRERYSVFLSAVYGAMTKNAATGDSLLARAERVDPALLTEYFRDSWREDLRPGLRSLKKPVHLVATEDLWPPAESWTSARKRLGYETAGPAMGHRVAGSAHMVALDQPDSLAAIIESVAQRP